jgi:hypothetical protein
MGLIIIPGPGDPEPEPGHQTTRIMPDEIRRWVAEAIAANRGVVRTTRAQEIMDAAVEGLHEEGELLLAAGLLLLSSARVQGHENLAVEALMQLAVDIVEAGGLNRSCRVCGCTQEHACPGGCSWVEFDLCSVCDARLKARARAVYKGSVFPGPGRDQ